MASLDKLNCLICHKSLKNPVTLPCGDNFCMDCIQKLWDENDRNLRPFNCPQCKKTFPQRPELSENLLLADMVKKLEEMGFQTSSPTPVQATAQAKPHISLPAPQGHQLVDAMGCVNENICSHHNKVLEIYCQDDDMCICHLCSLDKHYGHNYIRASKAKAEREDKLMKTQKHFKHELFENELKLKEFTQAMESLTKSAKDAIRECDNLFEQLLEVIQQLGTEIKDEIKGHEQVLLKQAKHVREQLEKRVSELGDSLQQWENLSHIQDPVLFLQGWQNLQTSYEGQEPILFEIHTQHTFRDIKKFMLEMKTRVESLCIEETEKISEKVITVHILAPPLSPTKNLKTPNGVKRIGTDIQAAKSKNLDWSMSMRENYSTAQTRPQLLKSSCQLTLNPDTAHLNLFLSERNRKVMWKGQNLQQQHHQHRFDSWEQVLCKEALKGDTYYWEVDWTGEGVYIGVAYQSVGRKGKGHDCGLGYNTKSWSLYCSKNNVIFWHNNIQTKINAHSISPRIGVHLDHKAGSLAFFNVSHTISRLHRYRTTFTEPLYAGFGLRKESSLTLCTADYNAYDLV